MGSLRDSLATIWSILTSKWYWIIITAATAIIVTPFLIVLLLLSLTAPWNFIAIILILAGWSIAAGYKDWILAKVKEEEKKAKP